MDLQIPYGPKGASRKLLRSYRATIRSLHHLSGCTAFSYMRQKSSWLRRVLGTCFLLSGSGPHSP